MTRQNSSPGKQVLQLLGLCALPFVLCAACGAIVFRDGFIHASPGDWRQIAREAKGDELYAVFFEPESLRAEERLKEFTTALSGCDDEAFVIAERLFPLIRMAAHAGEEFHAGLSGSLSVCPARTLAFVRAVNGSVVATCRWASPAARDGVTALFDSGIDEIVRQCLDELPKK
ncbi:MAG: hypothetical protein JNM17_15380 [Archangium sp.]|nr:hypothetical protein [Archangium sp.]